MTPDCACPQNFPDWHQRDIDLGGELAHILPIPMFLHMPIGFEAYVERQRQALARLPLRERWPGLVLTRSASLRGRIIRLLEAAVCPARHLEFLPSPFHLRGYLHQGDIGTISAGVRHIQQELLAEGRRPRELYLCYLTCPLCNEQRGGDKILLLRRWVESPALKKRITAKAG
ncbi:MAG: hypothetical protein ABIR48_03020 [Gammaproteobacteria bacterium]